MVIKSRRSEDVEIRRVSVAIQRMEGNGGDLGGIKFQRRGDLLCKKAVEFHYGTGR